MGENQLCPVQIHYTYWEFHQEATDVHNSNRLRIKCNDYNDYNQNILQPIITWQKYYDL